MTCAGGQTQKPGTTRRKKPKNLGFVKANSQKRRKLFALSHLPPLRKTCLDILKGCNSFFFLRNTLEQGRPKTCILRRFYPMVSPRAPLWPSPLSFPTPPPRRWPPRAMTCAGGQTQKPGTTRRKKPKNLGFVKANSQKRRKLFALSHLPPLRKTCLDILKGCNSFFFFAKTPSAVIGKKRHRFP